jgi:putative flippase GtrA
VTAERTLPESPSPRMHPTVRRISAAQAEPELVEQLAGIEALQALAVTQPLRPATNPRSVVSHRRASQVPVRDGASRSLTARAWDQRFRLLLFAVNGISVFAVGLLIQVILVKYVGMGHIPSYIVQTIASVQISFLLSRYLTWRDRNIPFLHALTRFNAQQLAITGLGMAGYAGLEQLGMNYIAANVAVTAVLTPVSFLSSHKWSMGERTHLRWRLTAYWPLTIILAVQTGLSVRLIWSNTAFIDEATYLYAGSQELDHWLHGTPVANYQTFLSGAPVTYPPIGAVANAIGGLAGARLLGLAFMLGSTTLLYLTARRLFGTRAAILGSALFAVLGVTQFLSAFATYDPMALFLMALASYLVAGRRYNDQSLTSVAFILVIAPAILALANATKYASALWDPIIVGLTMCGPVIAGHPWRYGVSRAARFSCSLAILITVGLAIGKGKYLEGITTTTVERSSKFAQMGEPASLVLHSAWSLGGLVIAIAFTGLIISAISYRWRSPSAFVASLLFLGVVAAPLNQARIGTAASLQKHVDMGAWFGCILAGYALAFLTRYRVVAAVCTVLVLAGLPVFYTRQASNLYHDWPQENPAFISALKKLVHPGNDKYLIEGYDDIPAYYIGPAVNSIQWKEAGTYSYLDPQTGKFLLNGPALTDAIRHRVFTLVILNFSHATSNEPANDFDVANAIARYGGYQIIGHLSASSIGSRNTYTVWRVTGGQP